jgi:seryl-tRNA synthetase
MRDNQKKRFKDVGLVETVISEDVKWRQLRYTADAYNRVKNLLSKAIGEKMKKKEEVGDTTVPSTIPSLDQLNAEIVAPLTLGQLKTLRFFLHENQSDYCFDTVYFMNFYYRVDLDKAMDDNSKSLMETETIRNEALKEIGNILHPSVPVDDNEDNNKVERTWGDVSVRKKYSHVDLIVVSVLQLQIYSFFE